MGYKFKSIYLFDFVICVFLNIYGCNEGFFFDSFFINLFVILIGILICNLGVIVEFRK